MTDCGRSVVAALSRYVSGRPWTDCRSAGNTDGHVVLASLRCALLRVPSLARTGAARQRPTNRRRLASTSFLLKPARPLALFLRSHPELLTTVTLIVYCETIVSHLMTQQAQRMTQQAPADRLPITSAAPGRRRWLLFVHQLPSHPSNLRVTTWRRLQQITPRISPSLLRRLRAR